MKALIIYMSSHGCAAKAAKQVADGLARTCHTEVSVVDLEHDAVPDLSGFELIIIGGSIRIGTLQKRVKKFMEKNLELLLEKPIGLYICCMYEGEKAAGQMTRNFPEPLLRHARALGYFGGELDFNVMNSFERMIIKDIIGISVNVSLFDEKAVKEFVSRLMSSPETPVK